MQALNLILSFVLVSLISSCSSPHVFSDYQRGTDFSKYKTYSFLDHEDKFPVGVNPINKHRIEQAIEKEMAARGYQKSEDADFQISWFVKIEVHRYYVEHREYYGQLSGRNMGDGNWYEYKVGSLVIDLIDAAENQAVWHGVVSGIVNEEMKNVEEKINQAVGDLFDRYQEETAN